MPILSPEMRLLLMALRYAGLALFFGTLALGLAPVQWAALGIALVYGVPWCAAHGTTIAVQRGLLRLPPSSAGLSAQAHAELERPATPEEAP
jgi:hypothetical protein